MTTELTILGWLLVLALVQILWPAILRNGEVGLDYNASPRDTPAPVPPGILTGRLQRAQANLFETLPLFAIAILIAHFAGRTGSLTYWGAWIYLLSRVTHLPLYAAGVPKVRSIAFGIGIAGICLILIAILGPR